MSGHSKWATTRHKKAVVDARRGKLFAKLIKNVEVAARTGGGDPAGNPTLYDAIQKAKKSSVPNDNIERAVKRGSGAEAGGAVYQAVTYEGYGPGGVAVLVECLTDNRNRAASEVRIALTRNGGSMADPGSVSYMFSRKGVVVVPRDQGGRQVTEDDVLEAVLDAGAEEVERSSRRVWTTSPRSHPGFRRSPFLSTRRVRAGSSGWSRPWKTATTSKTCTRTTTSPTKSWRPSAENCGASMPGHSVVRR